MPTTRLLQRIPALISGISTQAQGIRYPEQLQDATNVVFSLTDGARRRSGTQAWWTQQAGDETFQYRMYRIERDDVEEYAVVYGRDVFKVLDLRNQYDCDLEFDADAWDYLRLNSPRAEELRFVTIADTTIIANTTVNTALVSNSYGAKIDANTMPVQLQRLEPYPNARFKLSLIDWAERTYNTQLLIPEGTSMTYQFSLTYKGESTFDANDVTTETGGDGSTSLIPTNAKASDVNADSETARGGIEQYLSGNGKKPQDFSEQEPPRPWEALRGLKAFPFGKVICTGGPLRKPDTSDVGTPVKIKFSPDLEIDEMLVSSDTDVRVQRGDNKSNPPPSIVEAGMPITELAYHRNRLILASGEKINMSQADDLFNFYAEEEEGLSDSDPIDVELAATDVCIIEQIMPYRNTMLIMTKAGQQFELQATDVLGPNTINITPTTRYPAQSVRPIQQGDRVYFAGAADQNAIIYEYYYADTTASSVAANVTKHVDTLLPNRCLALTGAANSDSLYVLAVPENPSQIIMSATEGQTGEWDEGTSWTTGIEPNPWDEIIIVEGDTVAADVDGGVAAEDPSGPGNCYGKACVPIINPRPPDSDDPQPPPEPCTCVGVDPPEYPYPASGGNGSFAFTLSDVNCEWQVIAPDWITITSPTSGTGSGVVTYDVSANLDDVARTGVIFVNACSHIVYQDGGQTTEETGETADGTIYAYRQYTTGTERKQSAWSRWTFGDDAIMDAITIDDELFTLRRTTRYNAETGYTHNHLVIEKMDISDAVPATAGFAWRVHLDHMVLGVAGEYDSQNNTTTWDLDAGIPDWRDPDVDTIVARTDTGIVERRNALVTVDPTGRYVSTAGDFSAATVALGRSFVSAVTLSPLYFRAEQPVDDGRTQIVKVLVGHTSAGAYQVAVANRNGQPTRYTRYSPASLDTTGVVQAWVMARNRDATIRLESADHRPCSWTSVEIHGTFGSNFSG